MKTFTVMMFGEVARRRLILLPHSRDIRGFLLTLGLASDSMRVE